MLVSVVMSKRPSSLKLMTVAKDFFRLKEDSVEFVLVGLEKHSGKDYVQKPVVLTKCDITQLDPVSNVKEYVRRTKRLRKLDQLIISDKKPYEAASMKLIAKYLAGAIEASGQCGTGSSLRSKAATRARLRGAS